MANEMNGTGTQEAWFFGYGSLIFDPCNRLGDWCEPPIDGEIKAGIEFLHSSSIRCGAPTLCFDGTNRKTPGKCWRAVGEYNYKCALAYVKRRERKVKSVTVVLGDGRSVTAYCGDTYPDLVGKTAKQIAYIAVESEGKAASGRGGVTYIRRCSKIGIYTPMIKDILEEIGKLS